VPKTIWIAVAVFAALKTLIKPDPGSLSLTQAGGILI
jgi:hypothetical protein